MASIEYSPPYPSASAGSPSALGFYGHPEVARTSGYTLTFATASRVLPASTATGTGTLLTEAFTQLTALVTDLTETKKVLNQLIKDLQGNGLLQ
jgi:hypothetical protein